MKKYVIYRLANLEIVKLSDNLPSFNELKDDEDFDTVERWLSTDTGKEAIELFMKEKPVAKVLGEDSNVFNLTGICSKALKRANQSDNAKEMTNRIFSSGSYEEALSIMGEYCELT